MPDTQNAATFELVVVLWETAVLRCLFFAISVSISTKLATNNLHVHCCFLYS